MNGKRKREFRDHNEVKRARTKTNRFGTRESTGATNYHHHFEKYAVADTVVSSNEIVNETVEETNSNEKVLDLVIKMSCTIEALSNRLSQMAEELRRHKSLSALEIGGGELEELEKPQFDKLQKFELPIKTKERLNDFETDLRENPSFKKFCVSIFES